MSLIPGQGTKILHASWHAPLPITYTHTHTLSLSLSLFLKEGAFLRMYVFIVLLSTDSEAITIPGRLKSTVLIIIEGCGTSSSRNADCLIYSS